MKKELPFSGAIDNSLELILSIVKKRRLMVATEIL